MLRALEYDGVVRIEVSRRAPTFPVNFYFVDGLLIDSGNALCARQSTECLHRKKLAPKMIVNTHYHPDHTGGNALFAERFYAPIFAHRLALPRLASPVSPFLFSTLLHGTPPPSCAREVPAEISMGARTFAVLHVPGHSDDHVALYEKKEKWAFTGDLVLAGETREVFVDVRIYDALSSLQTLSRLDIRMLFPGHGSPIVNPRPLLLEKIDFLGTLGEEVRRLQAEGFDRVRIRRRLFGRERAIAHLCQKKFSAQNLVDSFLAR